MSPAVSSPVSVGLPGVTMSGRGISPGGRHWGSTASTSAGGSHSSSHLGSGHWGGGSSHALPHYPHYPHSVFNSHHTTPSVYHPPSVTHQHGTAMEDDKEVVQNARAALDWLERGDSYS
jgi:hypothetical protein